MNDIRWESIEREIIHAFIEFCMKGNFDFVCGFVEPENIASGVRDETKKCAFSRTGDEFCCTTSRGTDPYTGTESFKVSEIFLFSSCHFGWREGLSFLRKGVDNSKRMVECIWPEADWQVCTREKRTYHISNSAMSAFDWSVLV